MDGRLSEPKASLPEVQKEGHRYILRILREIVGSSHKKVLRSGVFGNDIDPETPAKYNSIYTSLLEHIEPEAFKREIRQKLKDIQTLFYGAEARFLAMDMQSSFLGAQNPDGVSAKTDFVKEQFQTLSILFDIFQERINYLLGQMVSTDVFAQILESFHTCFSIAEYCQKSFDSVVGSILLSQISIKNPLLDILLYAQRKKIELLLSFQADSSFVINLDKDRQQSVHFPLESLPLSERFFAKRYKAWEQERGGLPSIDDIPVQALSAKDTLILQVKGNETLYLYYPKEFQDRFQAPLVPQKTSDIEDPWAASLIDADARHETPWLRFFGNKLISGDIMIVGRMIYPLQKNLSLVRVFDLPAQGTFQIEGGETLLRTLYPSDKMVLPRLSQQSLPDSLRQMNRFWKFHIKENEQLPNMEDIINSLSELSSSMVIAQVIHLPEGGIYLENVHFGHLLQNKYGTDGKVSPLKVKDPRQRQLIMSDIALADFQHRLPSTVPVARVYGHTEGENAQLVMRGIFKLANNQVAIIIDDFPLLGGRVVM